MAADLGSARRRGRVLRSRPHRDRLPRGRDPGRCRAPVCTENSILIDYVTESPNVSDDDRSVMLLPDPARLAVQVEEPT
jgi:hypothetical protein